MCALLAMLQAATAGPAFAIDLQPETSLAFDAYRERVRAAFLERVRTGSPVVGRREGVLFARAAGEDGIISVDGGLVHHWVGAAFLSGATLRDALDVSRDYAAYTEMYRPVIASRLLAHEGNIYRVLVRVREGEAGITAVLDVESTVEYAYPVPRAAYAISDARQIREVRNAGRPDEERLAPGRDRGFLWRASTFTLFRETDEGVYVEMETLGLSRRFPPMLGWIIEPIARRMGRKSVEQSLDEFLRGVLRRVRVAAVG